MCSSDLPSTVAREVRHNSGKSGYRAFSAGNRANVRASSSTQGKSRWTRDDRRRGYVMEKLQKRGSPRELVKRIAPEYPDERTMRISHEAIDRSIYVLPRGSLKTTRVKALRQARAYRRTRKRRNHQETRGKIVERLSIEERPHPGQASAHRARHLGGPHDAVYHFGPVHRKRCDIGAERLCESPQIIAWGNHEDPDLGSRQGDERTQTVYD